MRAGLCIAAVVLAFAGEARAEWLRLQPSPTSQPLRGVAIGPATQVWAVGGPVGGGTPGVLVKVRTDLTSPSASTTFTGAGTGTLPALNQIAVSADGASVGVFGWNRANAKSTDGGANWSTVASPYGTADLTRVFGLGLYDPAGGNGYVAGWDQSLNKWFFGSISAWAAGSNLTTSLDTFANTPPVSSTSREFVTASYVTAAEGFLATGDYLIKQTAAGSFTRLQDMTGQPTQFKSVSAIAPVGGTQAIAVGLAGLVLVIDPTSPNGIAPATAPGAPTQNFNGVALASSGKFGVVVGDNGFVAETYDGGRNWVSRTPLGTPHLRAVTCFDENTCAAVGDAGEVLTYRNKPPAPNPASIPAQQANEQTSNVCVATPVVDTEGDPITATWTLPASLTNKVETFSAGTAQVCFTTPAATCVDQTITGINLSLGDGRLQSTSNPVTLVVKNSIADPPSPPTLVQTTPATGVAPTTWTPGTTYSVQASANPSCGGAVSYAFTPSANLGTPTIAGDAATFAGIPLNCTGTGQAATIKVDATESGAASSQTFNLTVAPTKDPPTGLSLTDQTATPAFTWQAGGSYSVKAAGTAPCGPISWSFTNTDVLPKPTFTNDVATFDLGGLTNTICADTPVTLEYVGTSNGVASAPATQNVKVVPAASVPIVTNDAPVALNAGDPPKPVSISASHPCTSTFTYAWACTGVPNPSSSSNSINITNAASNCVADTVTCTVTVQPVLAGSSVAQPTGSTTFSVKRNVMSVAPIASFSIGPAASLDSTVTTPPTVVAGKTANLAIAATHACDANATYAYDWSACTAFFPNPGNVATTSLGNASRCDPKQVTCNVAVTATVDGVAQPVAQVPVRFDLQEDRTAPTLVPAATNPSSVAAGASAPFGVVAQHPGCSAFDYTWTCTSAAWTTTNSATATLTNDNTHCVGEPASCDVIAKPRTSGTIPDSSKAVVSATLSQTNQKLQVTVPADSSTTTSPKTLTAVVSDPVANCSAQPRKYAWVCKEAGSPDTISSTLDVSLTPANSCGNTFACTFTASAADGSRAGQGATNVTFTPIPQTTTTNLTSKVVTLANPGDQATVTSAPTNACANTGFKYQWDCNLPASYGTVTGTAGESWHATHPANGDKALCLGDVTKTCSLTATPLRNGQPYSAGTPGTDAFDLTYERDTTPFTSFDLKLNGGGDKIPTGVPVQLYVSSANLCAPFFDYDWKAVKRGETTPFKTAIGPTFTLQDDQCGTHLVEVTATSLNAPSQVTSTATFTVEVSGGRPHIAAPADEMFEPSDSPRLDCADPAPIVIRPSIPDGDLCSVKSRWSQVTTLPLETRELDDRALEVRVAPAQFAEVVGKKAVFQLDAEDGLGPLAPQQFEVFFEPQRMVHLQHLADRAEASSGDVVTFAVDLDNRCELAGLPSVEVHLALSNLEIVPGSAKLGDAPLGDPTGQALDLVFPVIPLPALRDGPPPTLTYQARRLAIAQGDARAVARAYFPMEEHKASRPERVLVSDDAPLETAPYAAGVPVVACGCSTAPDASFAAALAGLALLLSRRNRSKS